MAVTSDTEVGREFSGRARTVAAERALAFSGGPLSDQGWPKKNIHTDTEFARACGLPDRIVSATHSQGFLVGLMLDLFGEAWLSHGTMAIKFIAIVPVGDTVTPKAAIRRRDTEGSGVKFDLDVWCENREGKKVAVGTATGIVRSGGQ